MAQVYEIKNPILRYFIAIGFAGVAIISLVNGPSLYRSVAGCGFFEVAGTILLLSGIAYFGVLVARGAWLPLAIFQGEHFWVRGGFFWPFQRSHFHKWESVSRVVYGKTLADSREYVAFEFDGKRQLRLHEGYSSFAEAQAEIFKFADRAEKTEQNFEGTAYVD